MPISVEDFCHRWCLKEDWVAEFLTEIRDFADGLPPNTRWAARVYEAIDFVQKKYRFTEKCAAVMVTMALIDHDWPWELEPEPGITNSLRG